MSDLGDVLAPWRAACDAGEEYVLATVVDVDGSSYRKPGARMLLTSSGRRAGSISGGCLEGEVSRKAWWLTEAGPAVQRYSTFFDVDGDVPYGLGCGGRVSVLLERRQTADPLLRRLDDCYRHRVPCAVATVIDGDKVGRRWIDGGDESELSPLAAQAREAQRSFWALQAGERIFAEFVPARTGLFVFGAGDDAQPLVSMARLQGWHTTVLDGRSNLLTRDRFPNADALVHLRDIPGQLEALQLRATDAAVLMTHSYEQDRRLLQVLLPRTLRYLGALGPRKRTQRLLEEIAPELGWSVEASAARVKSPVGLDLGGETAASIALSIAAELEAVLHHRSPCAQLPPVLSHA